MKKLLLPLIALSMMIVSCNEKPNTDPAPTPAPTPASPYAISADGKVTLRDITVSVVGSDQHPLPNNSAITVTTSDNTVLAQAVYASDSARIDLSQSIDKIKPIMTIRQMMDMLLPGCEISDETVKIIEICIYTNPNNTKLEQIGLNLTDSKGKSFQNRIFYATGNTTIKASTTTANGSTVTLDGTLQKGFNDFTIITTLDEKSAFVGSINALPTTGLHWIVSAVPAN